MTSFNNTSSKNPDIRVRLENGTWVPANNHQRNAFIEFSKSRIYSEEYNFNIEGVLYKIQRRPDRKILFTREDGASIPIADWNNVKVFLVDVPNIDWYNAKNYQRDAYFDFVYSNDVEKYYASFGSRNLNPSSNYAILPTRGIPPDIVFRMSRNENQTVFYEKDNRERTRVRISDSENERIGYSGFYHRMTEPIATYVVKPASLIHGSLARVPNVPIIKTANNEELRVVCNENEHNTMFSPRNTMFSPRNTMCRSNVVRIIPYVKKENEKEENDCVDKL